MYKYVPFIMWCLVIKRTQIILVTLPANFYQISWNGVRKLPESLFSYVE